MLGVVVGKFVLFVKLCPDKPPTHAKILSDTRGGLVYGISKISILNNWRINKPTKAFFMSRVSRCS